MYKINKLKDKYMKKSEEKVSKETIIELLASNKKAILRGLLTIYNLQTTEEKFTEHTYYHNNVGFTGVDGKILSSIASQVITKKKITKRQFEIVEQKMKKYAGQLYKVANGLLSVPTGDFPTHIEIV
jgi:hypothetical protein